MESSKTLLELTLTEENAQINVVDEMLCLGKLLLNIKNPFEMPLSFVS